MNIALSNLTINSYKKKLEQDSEPHYQTPLQDLQDFSLTCSAWKVLVVGLGVPDWF